MEKEIDIADTGYGVFDGRTIDFEKLFRSNPYPKEAIAGIEQLYRAAETRSDRARKKAKSSHGKETQSISTACR